MIPSSTRQQKNFTHVRELFGYDRIVGREMAERMNRIYQELWCPLHNFFLPTQKLLTKTRVGARYVKKYDLPRTPYQRLLECSDEVVSGQAKAALTLRFQSLIPFELRLKLEMELKSFFDQLRRQKSLTAA